MKTRACLHLGLLAFCVLPSTLCLAATPMGTAFIYQGCLNDGSNPVYVNRNNAGTEDGSSSYPWNTVTEGYASVQPQGTVHIAAGNYGEAMFLGKA